MKKILMMVLLVWGIWAEDAYPHEMYVKKNPTNENGIEFGVNDASSFVRWRAYVKGLSNNGQGDNAGWSYANGWWYYELSSISQRVMWRTTGLQNQKFVVTYWVSRAMELGSMGRKLKSFLMRSCLLPISPTYSMARFISKARSILLCHRLTI